MKLTKIVCLISICHYVMACGSSPNEAAKAPVNKPQETQNQTQEQDKDELDQIAQAYRDDGNLVKRNAGLLSLADKHIQKQDCKTAIIIAKQIEASLQDTSNMAVAQLIKAECGIRYLYANATLVAASNKDSYVDNINTWLSKAPASQLPSANSAVGATSANAYSWQARKRILQASLAAFNEDYQGAVNVLMLMENDAQLFEDPNYSNTIWSWYSLVDADARLSLARQHPSLLPFKSLLDIIEDESISDSLRQASLSQWVRDNADTKVAQNIPQQLVDYLALSQLQEQNIAVLLPLSGRLSSQGEAIKDGILAAYYQRVSSAQENNSQYNVSLEFIDTGSFNDLAEGVTQTLLSQYDTIIGPLLRSHIDPVRRLTLANAKQLVLNFVPSQTNELPPQLAMFSLSPEQEAKQLVSLMREQNISNPVVITDSSNVPSRMNDAFAQAWQASNPENQSSRKLQQITFTDNKSMKAGITSALDVLQSQNRINQLSRLSNERIISVTRNRRDVDAFVVFAKPDDVELINPIIESSISLFSNEQIPVFASSYSYDHKQNKNTQRDLRNLVFTDMPWLLPEGRNQSLSKTVDTLYNQPPSAFLRLFAFGYDSVSLVDNLAKLTTFSHMSLEGLSGELSIDENHQVTRKLPFIVINDNTNSD